MSEVYKPEAGIPIFLHVNLMPHVSEWVPYVVSWDPVNLQDYGSACRVTFENGSYWIVGRGSQWILHTICRYHNIDIRALRHKYFLYVDLYQWVPIYIPARKLVFFAVKTRIPHSHNDFASGYIANTQLASLEALDTRSTRIHLSNGHTLDVLMSQRSLKTRKNSAELFAYLLHRDGLM